MKNATSSSRSPASHKACSRSTTSGEETRNPIGGSYTTSFPMPVVSSAASSAQTPP
jgi:hypothetical protein